MSEESSNNPVSQEGASESVGADVTSEDLQALLGEEVSSEASGSPVRHESGSAKELPNSAKAELEAAVESVEEASSAKQKAEAEKKLEKVKRKYNLKVDGKDIEWEGTEEDIQRELQLSQKARKDIQRAKEYEKEVSRLVDLLKNNPAAVLADPAIGIDVKKFAQDIINQELEDQMKSPEQLEKEKLEKELEEFRAKVKEDEDRRKQEDYARAVEKTEADIQEKFIAALDESNLPNSPYLVKRMADVMMTALDNEKKITPKQALNIVQREMKKDISEMFRASKEDILEELLGSDTVKRFNQYQLGKYKKSQSVPSTKSIKDVGASPSKVKEAPKPERKQTINDWLYGNKG